MPCPMSPAPPAPVSSARRSSTSPAPPASRSPRSAGRCAACRTSPSPPGPGSRRSPASSTTAPTPPPRAWPPGAAAPSPSSCRMINSWYFANVVAGAEAVCADDGYDLLVVTAPNPARAARGRRHRRRARPPGRRPDLRRGRPGDRRTSIDLRRRRLGVVTIGQETGACSVRAHRQRGHRPDRGAPPPRARPPPHRHPRRPGRGARRTSTSPASASPGAERALAAPGSTSTPTSSPTASSPSRAGTRPRSTCSHGDDRPTAIFALSDEMAFGAFVAARELGLDDPRRRLAGRRRRPRGRPGARPDHGPPARRRARGARRPRAAAPAGRRAGRRRRAPVGDVELVVRTSTPSSGP